MTRTDVPGLIHLSLSWCGRSSISGPQSRGPLPLPAPDLGFLCPHLRDLKAHTHNCLTPLLLFRWIQMHADADSRLTGKDPDAGKD